MVQAREVGAVDNSTYRDLNRDADTLTASRHLRRLCDLKLLEKKGKGAKTYYIPTDLALANWPPNSAKSQENEPKSRNLDGKSRIQNPTTLRRLIVELIDTENCSCMQTDSFNKEVLEVVLSDHPALLQQDFAELFDKLSAQQV